MEVNFIAADSMGARSMATHIHTKDVDIVIDPSVALGPWRYNKPPHPLEVRRRDELWEQIKFFASGARAIVVTHYHYDHHNPEFIDLFKDKVLFVKNPEDHINKSQKDRAGFFLGQIEGIPSGIHYSDGDQFWFNGTRMTFSKPVPHGSNEKLGYVTEVCIDDGTKFLYTSDIEGPCLQDQAEFILDSDPDILYCDGPMTYMLGFRYAQKFLDASIGYLIRIMEETRVKDIVLDHHLLRDIRWKERVKPVMNYARSSGVKIYTAAGYMGQKDLAYEARRSELYKIFPVTGPLLKKGRSPRRS